MTAPS